MDVILNTQSESHGLRMRNIELYADGSGGSCFMEVWSTPFSGAMNFFFDPVLAEFISQLESLNSTLVGTARLGLEHEDHYIEFSGNGRGQVKVCGLLCEYNEHGQQLRFSFSTDQTTLRPFMRDLIEASNAKP